MLLDDPSLIPAAVEESLRMFPAFGHFARTATHDTELAAQPIREGEKVVMWYASSGRDEDAYSDPDRFDVRRNPEHQAFGAGGRHFCLGTALARLELRVLFEETLAYRDTLIEKLGPTLVTYEIEPAGDAVRLTLTEAHDRPMSDDILSGGRTGWPAIMSSLKSLLETGKPLVVKMAPPARMLAALKELGIAMP